MSFLENKKSIEQFIYDNWTYTPIHWSGIDFNIEGLSEWIRIAYVPKNTINRSIDAEKSEIGSIRIAIFAKIEFRVFELSDLILEMFKNKKIGNNFVKKVIVLSNGQTSDNNYNYIDIQIEITTY